MRKLKRPLEFSQWRAAALEALIAISTSSRPVGVCIQALVRALVSSSAPDPRRVPKSPIALSSWMDLKTIGETRVLISH